MKDATFFKVATTVSDGFIPLIFFSFWCLALLYLMLIVSNAAGCIRHLYGNCPGRVSGART